jgi:hypothetical protein
MTAHLAARFEDRDLARAVEKVRRRKTARAATDNGHPRLLAVGREQRRALRFAASSAAE